MHYAQCKKFSKPKSRTLTERTRIFRRVHEPSYSSDDEFKYATIKQEYFIKDLERFNIKTLLVDEYSQITNILKAIENKLSVWKSFFSLSKWQARAVINLVLSQIMAPPAENSRCNCVLSVSVRDFGFENFLHCA